MINDKERTLFEETAERLTARLQFEDFGPQKYVNESESDWCMWSWLASWEPGLPKLSIWYGDWCDSGNKIFWVGFQGEKRQIDMVRKGAIGAEIIDHSNCRMRQEIWSVDLVEQQGCIIHEYDSVYNYFGRYDLNSDAHFEETVVEFLLRVSRSVQIGEGLKPTEVPQTIAAKGGRQNFGKIWMIFGIINAQ